MEPLHYIRTRVPLWFIVVWLCVSCIIFRTSCTDLSSSSRPVKLQNLLNSLRNYSQPEMEFSTTTKQIQSQLVFPSSTMSPTIQTSFPDKHIVSKKPSFPPSPINNYEDFYRVFYGTEEGVKHLKSQYGPNHLKRARTNYEGIKEELENVKKTNEHFLRIRTRARCKEPAPRVVRVKDYYPDPSREYLPRCTLLHVCGDSTGCCDSDAFHCVPTAMQEVTLTFYTLTVGKNGLSYSAGNSIEKLLFVNHTACDCLPVNDLPRIQAEDPQDGTVPKHAENQPKSHHRKLKCRECPVPFTSRIYRNGRCGCDCFDRQRPCLRIKRGREPLSEVERRCVEGNYCHIPDCEHGVFDTRTGYCPRRHDEERRPSKLHHSKPDVPSHHRWSHTERD